MDRVRIGCAGWSIPSKHSAAFPQEGTHLQRYAAVFNCVEINSSFYRPHQPKTYRKWAAEVPESFRFAVKMPKTISHLARLRHCDSLLEQFLAQAEQLGTKLGCLLLQLPPSLAFDARMAPRFFAHLQDRFRGRVACEPRHASWFTGSVERILRDFGIGRVAADPARVPRAAVPGGDPRFQYIRLHGSPRMYYDAYSTQVLDRIARKLLLEVRAASEVWCVFDNTTLGNATSDALALRRRLVK
jgi:uncharacterized protein YecE (DUF72 family)